MAAMEDENKTVKIKADARLRTVFKDLIIEDDAKRIEATQSVINILSQKQKEVEQNELCYDIEYAVGRLVQGVASIKKAAQLGYTSTLTQVLRHFPVVTVVLVIENVKKSLVPIKKDSLKDRSNALMGQIMVCLAIIQSDRLAKADDDAIQKVLKMLLSIWRQKPPLHIICTQALAQVISVISTDQFERLAWPSLQTELGIGWTDCSPDSLLLLLVAAKHHKSVVNKQFLKDHWDTKHVVSEKHLSNVAQVLLKSMCDRPVIHPICGEVVKKLGKKPELFCSFWEEEINGKCSTLHGVEVEKYIYLCFMMVPMALESATTAQQVSVVISPGLVKLLAKNLAKKNLVLHAASVKLVSDLEDFMQHSSSSDLQMAVLQALVFGAPQFDAITKTTTISKMLQQLKEDAAVKFSNALMDTFSGYGPKSSLKVTEVDQRQALSQLVNMITLPSCAHNSNCHRDILKFLVLHAFFDMHKPTDSIKQLKRLNLLPITPAVRSLVQDGFFKALSKLATFKPEKGSKNYGVYIDTVHEVVNFVKQLLENDCVKVCKTLTDEVKEELDNIMTRLAKFQPRKDGEVGESDAFKLLYLHLALQLFTTPEEAIDVLQDLYVCQEKALQKKRRSIKSTDSDGPAWVEVIVEMLLSMLSQQRHLVRVVVNNVFTILCPHITRSAVSIILKAISASTGDEDALLGFDEDSDVEDMEVSEEDEDSQSQTSSQATSGETGGSSEEDSDEDSSSDEDEEKPDSEKQEENGVQQEHMRASVKAALGNAAVQSDAEESDADLSDSEMLKLDGMLGRAFRSMSKSHAKKEEQEKKTQIKQFKSRCVDLLSTLVSSQPPVGILLDMLLPVLKEMDTASRDSHMEDLLFRCMKLLNKIFKEKTIKDDPSVEQSELPDMVKQLLQFSKKVIGLPIMKQISIAILIVLRVLNTGQDAGPSPLKTRHMAVKSEEDKASSLNISTKGSEQVIDMLKQALTDFCQRRDIYSHQTLLLNILQRQPVSLWELSSHLIQLATDSNVRLFCRTQMYAMLVVMLTKDTITQLDKKVWKVSANQIFTSVWKWLCENPSDTNKPKLMEEACTILLRILQNTKGTNQLTLPDDFEATLKQLKGQLNKAPGKRISALLTAAGFEPEKMEKNTKSDTTLKSKSSKKKPKSTESENNAENGENDTPKIKSAKKKQKKLDAENGENDTPKIKSAKKKQKKLDAQNAELNGPSQISLKFMDKTPAKLDKKQKRKSVENGSEDSPVKSPKVGTSSPKKNKTGKTPKKSPKN